MRDPDENELPDDVREAIEAFLDLPVEERLFPTDGGKVAAKALGILAPGAIKVTLGLLNPENGERLTVKCKPIRAIRRDVGKWSLMISVRILEPAEYAGVTGELVFARLPEHPPESVGFFKMSGDTWSVEWEEDGLK